MDQSYVVSALVGRQPSWVSDGSEMADKPKAWRWLA